MERRDFLRTIGLFAAALALRPKDFVSADYQYPYITQKTDNDCGIAVMAMIVSQNTSKDPTVCYKEILNYYKNRNLDGRLLGASELKRYLEEVASIPIKTDRTIWSTDTLKDQLGNIGSTVVSVSSNYREVIPGKNSANHWVIADKIEEIDGVSYAHVRDPYRSTEEYGARKRLLEGMLPADNGALFIPTDVFIKATGDNYLYTGEGVGLSRNQKKYNKSKFK